MQAEWRWTVRLSSAVLKTPVQLRGRPTSVLPGDEKEVDLIADYNKQVLEIHQDGRLVRVVPLADVGPMEPASLSYICEYCGVGFDDPKGLGPHVRFCKEKVKVKK